MKAAAWTPSQILHQKVPADRWKYSRAGYQSVLVISLYPTLSPCKVPEEEKYPVHDMSARSGVK